LGVKIKGGIELDLKAYRGTLDHPSVPGGGRGRLERWEKWRFPLDAVSLPSTDDGESWTAVRKIRRRRSFRLVDGRVIERPVSEAQLPGCSVELTEIFFGTERWWTLCFEAGGEARNLERELRATADLLLRGPRPAGVRLDLESSRSYPAWLNARVHPRIDPAERFAASLG
ncbi:MAG: hypothetical protein ACXVQ0_05140, partial [Actinomycetota bacterium]